MASVEGRPKKYDFHTRPTLGNIDKLILVIMVQKGDNLSGREIYDEVRNRGVEISYQSIMWHIRKLRRIGLIYGDYDLESEEGRKRFKAKKFRLTPLMLDFPDHVVLFSPMALRTEDGRTGRLVRIPKTPDANLRPLDRNELSKLWGLMRDRVLEVLLKQPERFQKLIASMWLVTD